ncbi:MAG: hypothetical protein JSS66_02095 [Armatimonadetes bacterium]|nr:hypothetical protein [Armatimonadota bacterium]
MLPFWPLLATQQEVRVGYEPFAGLQVAVNGVAVVRGSSFDYTAPGSGKSLYSSRWAPKDVSRLPDGTIRVRYSGDNGNAIGTHEFKQTLTGLTAHYEFRWRGEGEAIVQNVIALVWAPAVCHGDIKFGGDFGAPFLKPTPGDWDARKLGGPTSSIDFESQLARIAVDVRGQTVALYDARNYEQDWAKSGCLFWMGRKGMRVAQGQTLEMTAEWRFEPKLMSQPNAFATDLTSETVPNASIPVKNDFAKLFPPKESQPSGDWLTLAPLAAPSEDSRRLSELLKKRWVLTDDVGAELAVTRDGSPVPEEGFEVAVSRSGVRIKARDEAGVTNALQFLADRAEIRGGNLALPCGTFRDWPTVKWRGVHLFSGADTLDFQSRLASNVLAPLRFNHVLVQCERTIWDAVQGPPKSGFMQRPDLKRLFEMYREKGIVPVPLIQSFGHMDWLLDGQHRDLAVNPEIPYTLDGRKGPARDLISSVWREAIELLAPEAVHFGLDETDMRGMPDDPTLADRIWSALVPELFSLARSLKVRPMLWGDMMLSAGEGADATHAKSLDSAESKRRTLPKTATVFDWHYLNTDETSKFKSLKLWSDLGLKSVAASWWRPRNIRAHTMAAVSNGTGTLQTTWAGYQTTEQSVFSEPNQFAAYVLAADYAWTGRTDQPASLGYDSLDLVKRMLWGTPSPLRPLPGQTWAPKDTFIRTTRIGGLLFNLFAPVGLQTPLSGEGTTGHSELVFGVRTSGGQVALAMDCIGWEREGEPVAQLVSQFSDGSETNREVLYGADVRAPEDDRPTLRTDSVEGVAAVRCGTTPGKQLVRIKVVGVGQTAGVRVHGVTSW